VASVAIDHNLAVLGQFGEVLLLDDVLPEDVVGALDVPLGVVLRLADVNDEGG
jgi:hypothetical protein